MSIGFETLSNECIVRSTGQQGVHKLVEHCPAIQKEISNGITQPIICEEHFCRDLVCCPTNKDSTKKRLSEY